MLVFVLVKIMYSKYAISKGMGRRGKEGGREALEREFKVQRNSHIKCETRMDKHSSY